MFLFVRIIYLWIGSQKGGEEKRRCTSEGLAGRPGRTRAWRNEGGAVRSGDGGCAAWQEPGQRRGSGQRSGAAVVWLSGGGARTLCRVHGARASAAGKQRAS